MHIGFRGWPKATHHSPKSLMRMLGSWENPQARNLFKLSSTFVGERSRFKVATAGGDRHPRQLLLARRFCCFPPHSFGFSLHAFAVVGIGEGIRCRNRRRFYPVLF